MIKMVLKLPIKSVCLIIMLYGIVLSQSLFAQQQIKRLPQVKMRYNLDSLITDVDSSLDLTNFNYLLGLTDSFSSPVKQNNKIIVLRTGKWPKEDFLFVHVFLDTPETKNVLLNMPGYIYDKSLYAQGYTYDKYNNLCLWFGGPIADVVHFKKQKKTFKYSFVDNADWRAENIVHYMFEYIITTEGKLKLKNAQQIN